MSTLHGKRMNKNLRNTLKSTLKTELHIVYITTNHRVFLNENDALKCEEVEHQKKEKLLKQEKVIMNIQQTILKILAENKWGIYYKGDPLESAVVQDGNTVYKVNEVSVDQIIDALRYTENEREDKWEDNTQENRTDNESSIG